MHIRVQSFSSIRICVVSWWSVMLLNRNSIWIGAISVINSVMTRLWRHSKKLLPKRLTKLQDRKNTKPSLSAEGEKTKDLRRPYLIKRQSDLSSPNLEFVCVLDNDDELRVLHRVPENEQDTLALFWKLEGGELLPFERFTTLEHTANQGIDVIATFQESEESPLRIMEPIEFEVKYENFLRHAHNPKQTSLVICWEVERPKALKRLNPYTFRATIKDVVLDCL